MGLLLLRVVVGPELGHGAVAAIAVEGDVLEARLLAQRFEGDFDLAEFGNEELLQLAQFQQHRVVGDWVVADHQFRERQARRRVKVGDSIASSIQDFEWLASQQGEVGDAVSVAIQ